ncbi:hypothetical protein Pyn_08011 [Prunus yedoensis var. nudiflora]|uniref:Uncharacterized protein n=1 Tax=Prunus yedoensis var. nudiflora TaxID=2094558 RepID=A0A314XVY8_PRUYE|nr:hypothetical protein Pyn_08011 [Prunus yedoensis var. nudiflora]
MSTSSDDNANQGDSDGSWEYAPIIQGPLYHRCHFQPPRQAGDSDDPAMEINDMKNKLEHDSSLVHYWTQKCVGAEQKLAYLKRQVNKARYRKEKHRIRGQRQKHKAEDLQLTEEDATCPQDIDWDAITPSAAQQIISGGVHPPELGHQTAQANDNDGW